ncbi:mechanosensitive ion channel family protein [Butyrivibrio sp. VCB2006]|uniref:mechanosensitive ion channel family protein n=1 Tax=Butyrivibrio sp. VCB2006 TaxID=1280679 RepID=UPI0004142BA3|nr:mechanosensitive ion channel family protein [Butyrivibrio sp. VCB2006]
MKEVLDVFLKYILPFLVAYVLNLVMNKLFSKERLRGKLHLIFLKGIIMAILWAVAALFALSGIPAFSKTWETAIASSGIAAVVIGLAAQSTLSNVFAGISLSASRSRPFDIGDRVKIDSIDPGFVEDITLRHTVIKTYQNERIYVPNSTVGSSTVINYTQEHSYSFPITVSVAYGTDMQKAMDIMADVVEQHPCHFGVRPTVLCKSCDDSGVTLRVLVETRDFRENPKACSDCLVEIMKRFTEAGIEIPYNKLVVYDGDK